MKKFIFILITTLGCSCSNPQGNSQTVVTNDSAVTTQIPPGGVLPSYDKGDGPDGKALFKMNCAACHYASKKKSSGPGLAGVMRRVPSLDWVHGFVSNADSVIKSGDGYANKIFLENNKASQPKYPHLSNVEIDAILNYCDGGPDDKPVQSANSNTTK